MKNTQKPVEQLNIQTGYLYTTDGKKFDVSVILNFPTDESYELDEFPETNLIDFYFGDPNDSITNDFVIQFIEKQNKLNKLLVKLYELESKNPDDTELTEHIKFIQSQIKHLH
jgi:benzoyl-CoA reductase/2-hydroxyglutaryl-CoA dehydratase subunit BcrC/BadD/HgdB